ncbi:hypothetical protein JL721_13165 [Aureococcus anophagefferens]|nr:hypothetical protein JL721_13165 [Aureococcus anophagefferens]
MRLASLLLVAAWSAAAKPTPKVIYVNLDNDEVLAIQRLVEEETGSRWAAVAGAWGRYRLALFEQGDLDRLGVDGAELLARLTAEWTRNKKALRPLIFTPWASPADAEAPGRGRGGARSLAEVAALFDGARDYLSTTWPPLTPPLATTPRITAPGAWSTAEGAEVLVLDGFADDELRRALLAAPRARGRPLRLDPDWERRRPTAPTGTASTACAWSGSWSLRDAARGADAAAHRGAPAAAARAARGREPAGRPRVSYQLTPPDAAFGVSPCVANAVLPGDRHGFHDDADPAKLPPSAWTDAHGHYANRSPGRPASSAPDLPQRVLGRRRRDAAPRAAEAGQARHADGARPGRLLLMDQDVAHALGRTNGTAPPRYSLVLKLVLHPRDDPETGARFDASRRMARRHRALRPPVHAPTAARHSRPSARKTCADCIMKRSAAASSRPASDVGATLTNHAARLDDHETRIALVERTSSRADLAEWLELRDPAEPVGPGDLVECVDRKISREITGRGVLFIVSTEPFFTGNVPSDEVLPRGRAVAMIGQVPVKVRGAVRESQCLAASGEDDGTAVASDCPTGIKAMEAAEASESFELVRALVNAGSHAIAAPELTKKQKRRRARKQKKRPAADFVRVAADGDSETTDETDLDSLASSHSCVRTLLEQNRLLVEDKKQLYANVRGMRLLLRDLARLPAGRPRLRRARRAAPEPSPRSRRRPPLKVAQRRALLRSVVSLQSRARVRRACAVLYHLQSVAASTTIASSARRYLVLTTTVVGKLLSRTRLQAIELECMKQDLERLRHSKVQQARDLREERNEWLAAVEKTKAQKAAELEKTKERLAAATAYVASLERASRAMLAAARRFARALATVPCDRTRVIGVVAHVDAGKTTLSEEMLALSGAITRSGRVDSGSTATDFLAQERARGITISSAAAHLDWRGTRVVLVDTPGHVDFGHDVDRALRVMDGVVLVVDAVAGAQARTEAVARAALETFGLPCVAVVNKMDRPGADFGKALASVAARCLPEGCAVVPVQRPVAYLPSPREALAGDGAAAGDGFAGFVFKVAHDAARPPWSPTPTGHGSRPGLGELHLEVALERLRSDFGVDVTFGPPAVALREAPTAETRRPPFVYDRTLGESRLFCALELSLAPRAADVDGEAVYGGGPPRISLAPAARDALDGASKLHGAAAPMASRSATAGEATFALEYAHHAPR